MSNTLHSPKSDAAHKDGHKYKDVEQLAACANANNI